ncbi:DUF5655 domain-containing protein [Actinomycetota bacterium Odt1-20B]
MSNLKVFKVTGGQVSEVAGASVSVEVELQRLIEANMETVLGIRFLATEYRTGRHGGRIDSLGIDDNGTPVIVEYKRTKDECVIVQSLSYLCWLGDHHHEFENLVRDKLGNEAAKEIDWNAPRIVCVAGSFTRHDTAAIEMIKHRIDLVTYKVFDDALTLQLIAANGGSGTSARSGTMSLSRAPSAPKSVEQYLDGASDELKELYAELDELLLAHRDVRKEPQLHYVAYRRIQNVATVRVQPRSRRLVVNLKLDPGTVELRDGFCRDMRGVGVLGLRGGVEVRIGSREDLVYATPLIQRSIDES